MSGCMRQLSTSDSENELESLSKLILTIGREYEREFSQIQTVIYKPKESVVLFFVSALFANEIAWIVQFYRITILLVEYCLYPE